ncbi:MAG: NCS2 family permease [Clostridiales bacterium]|jgi:AGZA family xanthine/uracil permease-like MFS transporter|nr:NCS2 family permease [Clostridiales bacterium]
MKQKLDNYFGITKMGSSFKVEILAGIVTFATVAYILTLNPLAMQGFQPGVRTPALIVATALGCIIGTLLTSLYARLPFVQCPGMGLNSMFAGVLAGAGSSLVFENALAIIFISGIVFVIVSVLPIGRNSDGSMILARTKLFDSIPKDLKIAIASGIGLFVAFIGLKNAGVIAADPGTFVTLVDFGTYNAQTAGAITCIFGFVVICVLSHYNVKGAALLGLLAATVFAGVVSLPLAIEERLLDYGMLRGESGVSWKFWESFSAAFSGDPETGAFGLFAKGFNFPAGSFVEVMGLIIAFSIIDIFDTMGGVMALSQMTQGRGKGQLIGEDGKPIRFNRALMSDALATVLGSVVGVSNVVIYIESGSGIAEGGRTGFSALVMVFMFVLSLFILPIFAFIPGAAAASVLLYVGVLMIGNITNINFRDIRVAAPAFLAIAMMPLTYSIANGIGLGVIAYVLITTLCWVVENIKGNRQMVEATMSASMGEIDPELWQQEQSEQVHEDTTDTKTKFPSITAFVIAGLFLLFFILG